MELKKSFTVDGEHDFSVDDGKHLSLKKKDMMQLQMHQLKQLMNFIKIAVASFLIKI